jgi:hypothetical protein
VATVDSKNVFGGLRSEYKKFQQDLKLAWRANGVESIARNLTVKQEFYIRSGRSIIKERKDWDRSNAIAKGILLLRLNWDLRKYVFGR